VSKRILMVEDEHGIVLSVGDRLRAEGYDFESVPSAETASSRLGSSTYHLVLLDIMLPGMSGFELIKALRAKGAQVPILVLSARSGLSDRVSGLRLGADDYLVKPFAMDELVVRIEVLLRRGERDEAEGALKGLRPIDTTKGDVCFGPFRLCFRNASLYKNDAPVLLSNQEFRLLSIFTDHPGEVLPPELLLNLGWGYESDVSSRTLYVHVAWLRKKLANSERPDGYIHTVRKIGYIFSE